VPSLNTVFAGSPDFAAAILRTLADTKYAPQAVFSQPDRPKGRGRKVVSNAVKKLAQELNIPVEQPATLRDAAALAKLAQYKPDIIIVAAYGLILPEQVLHLPRFGCINVHASLLPRWRGAAPIERAIMAGDRQTGVCIMQMEKGLDTGPVYLSKTVPIDPQTRAQTLEHTLAKKGAKQLIAVLEQFAQVKKGTAKAPKAIPQEDHLATYAEKLTAADRHIDWQLPAEQTARRIIAMADRLPVRVTINDFGVQLLEATSIEQPLAGDEHILPGTIIDTSKDGLLVQCATDLLLITRLKVERGKGSELDPAAAINGFKDLFYTGARVVA
jgi:methionyl-tRNA formyltransferase